jgi:hypothetical protein
MPSPLAPKSWLDRLYPPGDGTRDAPIDARSNRLFLRIAIGTVTVGAVLVVCALIAR